MIVPFQSMETPPDVHGHVCEHCNTSFTHAKSEIAPGQGHYAHVCPNPECRKPVNIRVELTVFNGDPLIRPDYVDWYGVDSKVGRVPTKPQKPRRKK